MLKILIVDDEPDICELIHKLIDWEELELTSLGSSQNGIDAMEIILRQKPDIVITDIQMPGMTGLEMIEKAIQQKLQTKFIVVSGYREFEYAQQAIRFGVEDYLLKPISKTDLNLVLKRLLQENGAVLERRASENAMRNELRQKTVILRGNELRQTLTDYSRAFHNELFSFKPGVFLVVCVHVSYRDKTEINRGTIRNVLENIALRVQALFKDDVFDMEYVVTDCNAYILTNYSEECHTSYRERCSSLQSLLGDVSIQYQNLLITFAIGSPYDTPKDIWKAFESAEDANVLRIYTGSSKLIEHRKLRAALPDTPECKFSAEDSQALIRYIETLQKDAALALIRSVYGTFRTMESYCLGNLFRVTRTMILRIRQEVVNMGLRENLSPAEEKESGIPSENMVHKRLANCDTVDEQADFLCEYVSSEIDYCIGLQMKKVGEPIRIAQEYVRAHIDRQISLEEVSEQAFVSAGYLSTLFKERTGKNFSDYVIEMRIEEAKRLLRQPALSMSDIAERIGYADARHFSKVFQKMVGVKPTAYRKFYV